MGNVSGQKGCGRKVGKEGTHVGDMFIFGRAASRIARLGCAQACGCCCGCRLLRYYAPVVNHL